MTYYLDTSAFLKLVVSERETPTLLRWARDVSAEFFASELLRTEALRAARRHSPQALLETRSRLEAVTLLSVTTDICERAAELDPGILRTLDTLHLATALTLAEDLEGIVTYDVRLAAAAALHGVSVTAPR